MSSLPERPVISRQATLHPPLPFHKAPPLPDYPPADDEWSAHAFWYTVLFLGCMAVTLMAWGAVSALPRAGKLEKPLHAEHPVPKLKEEVRAIEPPLAQALQMTLAEPPPPPLPPPDIARVEEFGRPVVPVPAKTELPDVPVRIEIPAVPAPEPMRMEAPSPAPSPSGDATFPMLPLRQEPTIFLARNLGETPMIRNWKTLALFSLMAIGPVAAPAPVQAGGTADEKLTKRIDDLITLMNEAVKAIHASNKGVEGVKLGNVDARRDLDTIKTRIDDLEKLIRNVHAEVAYVAKNVKDLPAAPAMGDRPGLEELRRQVASLEQAVLRLRMPEPGPARIALSPPNPTGKVILANMYHEEMLFVINQKSQRVAPGGILPMESVPAGALTYEVVSPTWGLRARTTTNLPANETLTLTAR